MVLPVALRERWTLADLCEMELPSWLECCRIEVVDGELLVTPPDKLGHTRTGHVLSRQVQAQCEEALSAVTEADIQIGVDGDSRRPDLVVVRHLLSLESELAGIPPSHIELVVEVESPGSRSRDRVTKPREYAAEGIRAYWRIERDPLVLVAYELRDGAYVEIARAAAGTVQIGSWTIDVDALG